MKNNYKTITSVAKSLGYYAYPFSGCVMIWRGDFAVAVTSLLQTIDAISQNEEKQAKIVKMKEM